MTIAISGPLQGWLAREGLLRRLGKAPWVLADQMLLSAANFLMMVCLARGMSPAAFGLFTLVYSILLFANSLQSGLVTQPHNVLGATRRGEDYRAYTATTAFSQLVLGGACAILSLSAWGVALARGWELAPLLLALAPAILAWQFQEFARRVLYTEGRVAGALVNDLIGYGGQSAAILALWQLDRLTPQTGLYALVVTNALGALCGFWQIRGSLIWRLDLKVLGENWHFGKWLAGSEVVGNWLATQLFIYLAAFILGTAAVGILKAVQVIFGPARIMAFALSTTLPIRFSRALASGGGRALHKQLMTMGALTLPLLGGYCLLVALFAKPLMALVYGDKYSGHAAVLALFSISAFIAYIGLILGAALRAQRATRYLFMSRLYASLATVPVAGLIIYLLGIYGAVLSTIATNVVLSLLVWQAYRRGLTVASGGTMENAYARGSEQPISSNGGDKSA